MRRWSEKKKRRGNKINPLHSFIMHCRGSRKKKKKKGNYSYPRVLVYICASLLQLTVESRDLPQAEININLFSLKIVRGHFEGKNLSFCEFDQLITAVFFCLRLK